MTVELPIGWLWAAVIGGNVLLVALTYFDPAIVKEPNRLPISMVWWLSMLIPISQGLAMGEDVEYGLQTVAACIVLAVVLTLGRPAAITIELWESEPPPGFVRRRKVFFALLVIGFFVGGVYLVATA